MMESRTLSTLLLLITTSFAHVQIAMAGDPNILTDFIQPASITAVDTSFFTYTGLRILIGAAEPTSLTMLKASMVELPAPNGQSVSAAMLRCPAGAVNPPHTHPLSAELLFLALGSFQVGFVDTTNKLYTQTFQEGDMFLFPKGLVHFQYNADEKNPAVAVSSFGSANPGTVSVPNSAFTTGIDNNILAKSFKTDVATIQKIKAGLAP